MVGRSDAASPGPVAVPLDWTGYALSAAGVYHMHMAHARDQGEMALRVVCCGPAPIVSSRMSESWVGWAHRGLLICRTVQ